MVRSVVGIECEKDGAPHGKPKRNRSLIVRPSAEREKKNCRGIEREAENFARGRYILWGDDAEA